MVSKLINNAVTLTNRSNAVSRNATVIYTLVREGKLYILKGLKINIISYFNRCIMRNFINSFQRYVTFN
jgi:hypothetical protein